MNFIKNIFNKAEIPIPSNENFWNWFAGNAKKFLNIVKAGNRIVEDFFNKLSPKLNELKEGYFYSTGMLDDNTAELVFTSDGEIKNFVFIEQLVDEAPQIKGWKFTALKPSLEKDRFHIKMSGYTFSTENIFFYANDNPNYPDEIDITVVYKELTNENRDKTLTGVFVFLDNYLGELNFATLIDNVGVIGKDEVEKEVIPINKLRSFLIWREKEFVEKYEDVKLDIDHYSHSILEGQSNSGKPLFASINTNLLAWENKASHPWMLKFKLAYSGAKSDGLPDNTTFELLNSIEGDILAELKDINGHLYIGRETTEGVRTIYFACKEFRNCSRIANKLVTQYKGSMKITYDIYKDKYWQSLSYYKQ